MRRTTLTAHPGRTRSVAFIPLLNLVMPPVLTLGFVNALTCFRNLSTIANTMSEGELVFIICELVAALILIAAVWFWTARAFRRFGAKLDCCERGELEIEIAERGEPAELPGPKKLSPDGNNENSVKLPEIGRFNVLGAKIDELTARIDALTAFIERDHANPVPEHAKRRRRATLTLVCGRKRAPSSES